MRPRFLIEVIKADSAKTMCSCTFPHIWTRCSSYAQVIDAYARIVCGVCTLVTPLRSQSCVIANISLSNDGYVIVRVNRYTNLSNI